MSKPRYDWWSYEEWRFIDGYDGKYEVSNYGRVRSTAKFPEGIILKPQRKRTGYLCVNLYTDGKMSTKTIHSLVADAFIENQNKGATQVNHIDENKDNNHASNLERVSAKENANYGSRNERIVKNSDRKKAAAHLRKPVIQMSLGGVPLREYPSIRGAARALNIDNGQISNCCSGKKITAGGYMWRYSDEQT